MLDPFVKQPPKAFPVFPPSLIRFARIGKNPQKIAPKTLALPPSNRKLRPPLLPHHLLQDIGGSHIVFQGFHGIRSPPLGKAANLGGIAKHPGQRGFRRQNDQIAPSFRIHDRRFSSEQIRLNIPQKLIGSHHFQPHDRLQKHNPRLMQPLANSIQGGSLQSDFRRFHLAVIHVPDGDFHMHQRTTQRPPPPTPLP